MYNNFLKIEEHKESNRIQVIHIGEEALDKLIFPFNKFNVTSLEYKPFIRFSLAKSLDEVFENKYGRKSFKEHTGLSRELLRIRGTFFSYKS